MGMTLKGTQNRRENQQRNASGPRSNGAAASRQPPARQPEQSRSLDIQTDIPMSHSERCVVPLVLSSRTNAECRCHSELRSGLRSDRVAAYDPRAEIIDRPAAQQYAKRTGPKPVSPSNNQSTVNQPSIAQRFGFQAPQDRGQTSPQARTQGRSRPENSGLLGRLGGPARRDDSMMDTS